MPKEGVVCVRVCVCVVYLLTCVSLLYVSVLLSVNVS